MNLPWPELNNTEPIYGTYYKELPLSRELLSYWRFDSPRVELSLPAANQFVPKNLDILPVPSDVSKVPEEVEMEMGELASSRRTSLGLSPVFSVFPLQGACPCGGCGTVSSRSRG